MYKAQYKYEETEKGKETHRRYYQKHKKEKLEYTQNYRKTEKGKLAANKAAKNFAVYKHKTIKVLKINGCAICGYNKSFRALCFHHVNPKDKKFTLESSALSRKDTTIVDEVNKCILLCTNCHGEIHDLE